MGMGKAIFFYCGILVSAIGFVFGFPGMLDDWNTWKIWHTIGSLNPVIEVAQTFGPIALGLFMMTMGSIAWALEKHKAKHPKNEASPSITTKQERILAELIPYGVANFSTQAISIDTAAQIWAKNPRTKSGYVTQLLRATREGNIEPHLPAGIISRSPDMICITITDFIRYLIAQGVVIESGIDDSILGAIKSQPDTQSSEISLHDAAISAYERLLAVNPSEPVLLAYQEDPSKLPRMAAEMLRRRYTAMAIKHSDLERRIKQLGG